MSWQMLLGINLIAGAIREFLNKKVANEMQPLVGFFYIALFVQVWLHGIHLFMGLPPLAFDPILAFPGILFVFAFLAYFSALRISLSQSILFQSYSILVTIFLSALFLGEGSYFDITTLVGIKVVGGITLAFVALWYILHVGNKREEKLERKWFVYIFFTILFLGIGSFLSVQAVQRAHSFQVLFNQNISALGLSFVLIAAFYRKAFYVKKKFLLLTIGNAFFSTIAVLAFFQMMPLIPTAKLFPMQQVSLVMLTIITGVVFYHEREVLSGKHLVGMGLGMIGILLLATS